MIRSGICTSAKREFLRGDHRPGHIYRMALFIKGSPLDSNTVGLTQDLIEFESQAIGYTAGGKPLHGVAYGSDKGGAWMTFMEPVWAMATIKARGCLIYNDSLPGRPALAVVNFGRDIISDKGNFTVAVPKADSKTAIIRIG